MTYHITLTDPMNGTGIANRLRLFSLKSCRSRCGGRLPTRMRGSFASALSRSRRQAVPLLSRRSASAVPSRCGLTARSRRLKPVKSPVSTGCLAGKKTVLSVSIPAASIWKCVGEPPRASVHPSGGCAIFARCRTTSSCFLPEITPLAGFTARFLPGKWADKPAGAYPR